MTSSTSHSSNHSSDAVFKGDLGDIHLASILQMIGSSGKTGVFRLRNAEHRGDISFLEGRIIHAAVEGLEGEEAFYELIVSWKVGEFSFVTVPPEHPRTIHKGWPSLLLEASQREDEWAVLSKKIPSIHSIPVCKDWDEVSKASITPQEKALFYALDGRQTIEQIARSLGIGTFELCKALYGLLSTGRVSLVDTEDTP